MLLINLLKKAGISQRWVADRQQCYLNMMPIVGWSWEKGQALVAYSNYNSVYTVKYTKSEVTSDCVRNLQDMIQRTGRGRYDKKVFEAAQAFNKSTYEAYCLYRNSKVVWENATDPHAEDNTTIVTSVIRHCDPQQGVQYQLVGSLDDFYTPINTYTMIQEKAFGGVPARLALTQAVQDELTGSKELVYAARFGWPINVPIHVLPECVAYLIQRSLLIARPSINNLVAISKRKVYRPWQEDVFKGERAYNYVILVHKYKNGNYKYIEWKLNKGNMRNRLKVSTEMPALDDPSNWFWIDESVLKEEKEKAKCN